MVGYPIDYHSAIRIYLSKQKTNSRMHQKLASEIIIYSQCQLLTLEIIVHACINFELNFSLFSHVFTVVAVETTM